MPAWSGLFDNVYSDGPHALQVNIVPLRRKATRAMKRKSMKVINELIQTLNGAAVGGAALAQHTRIQAVRGISGGSQVDTGGSRPVETVDLINRVTTSADQTLVNTMMTEQRDPATYPADASGNGGGGKVGF